MCTDQVLLAAGEGIRSVALGAIKVRGRAQPIDALRTRAVPGRFVMSLKPGTTLGHYVITETVGHGGMSMVYRARQESLQRDVAIKVLPDFFASDEQFRERFAREAATIARLRHPNIVAIFDFGDEDGTLYIVTEFLGGDTLAKWLQGPRPLHELTSILQHLADALDYATARRASPRHQTFERDPRQRREGDSDGLRPVSNRR